jgi:hypothetical protein
VVAEDPVLADHDAGGGVVEVEEAAVVRCEAAVLLRVHADVSVLDEEVEGSACRLVADELRRVEGVARAADGTGVEAADLDGEPAKSLCWLSMSPMRSHGLPPSFAAMRHTPTGSPDEPALVAEHGAPNMELHVLPVRRVPSILAQRDNHCYRWPGRR